MIVQKGVAYVEKSCDQILITLDPLIREGCQRISRTLFQCIKSHLCFIK